LLLVLSIITSWWLVFVFKFFSKFRIDQCQAIVINYGVCTFISWLYCRQQLGTVTDYIWLPFALFLGASFFTLFNIIAYSTQKVGLTITSVANKLSLVIPVIIGVIVLHDRLNVLKIIGFVLALFAIYLITRPDSSLDKNFDKKLLFLPFILFMGNGINDSIVNIVQGKILPSAYTSVFLLVVFGMAFLVGTFYLSYLLLSKKSQLAWRNVIAGIILGVPNYFSLHFLIAALKTYPSQSGMVFTIVNIGIVILSALTGFFIFKEKMTPYNFVGFGIAILALLLISYDK